MLTFMIFASYQNNFQKEREVKTVIEKLTKVNFYVKIRENTKPMRQPSDDGRVNITAMTRVGTPLRVQRSHSLSGR